MASFSAGTTFTDGVANDVTAAKLAALVNAATPTSGLIQDRTAETTIASNDTLLVGDASDSNNLKRMTVANFNNVVTTGTGTAASPAIVPTGDTNTGVFFPAADTIAFSEGGAEAMRIDSSGNVGIGTTSPATQLQINSSATTYSDQLRIRNTNFGNADIGVGSGIMAIATDTANITFHTSSNLGTTGSAVPNNERLRVDSNGNVGIGETNPLTRLHIKAASTSTSQVWDGGTDFLRLTATGNFSEQAIAFEETGSNVGAKIGVKNTAVGAYDIIFANRANTSSTSSITEKMRINSSGNVGIGTSSPSAQLELSTDSAKKPSTNTWTIASDQRLKTNITNADNDRCYEIVKQVPLKRYTWKNEVYSQDKVKDRSKLGWIAQDVEAVFPKAVGTNRFAYNQVFEDVVTPELDSDGNAVLDENGVAKTKTEKRLVSEEVIEDCKDLNSDQIYAAMYGTIQKLIEKVETLEAKVAALEAA